jgi:N utilization substance protein B
MPKPRRRRARELALQILFQIDVGGLPVRYALEITPEEHPADEDLWEFARRLVLGVMRNLPEIDTILEELVEGWSLERMANVDRCVLRMALYEMMHVPETPPRVVINEAIELAKTYSTDDSGRFVNGVLAAFARREGLLERESEERS